MYDPESPCRVKSLATEIGIVRNFAVKPVVSVPAADGSETFWLTAPDTMNSEYAKLRVMNMTLDDYEHEIIDKGLKKVEVLAFPKIGFCYIIDHMVCRSTLNKTTTGENA